MGKGTVHLDVGQGPSVALELPMRLEKLGKILISQIIGTEVTPFGKPPLTSSTGLSVLSLLWEPSALIPVKVFMQHMHLPIYLASFVCTLLTEGTLSSLLPS